MRDIYTDSGRADEAWDNQMRAFETTVGRWPNCDISIPVTAGASTAARTNNTAIKKRGFLGKLLTGAAIAAGAAVVAGLCAASPAPKPQAKTGGDKCEV
jgi:hypothetical protein